MGRKTGTSFYYGWCAYNNEKSIGDAKIGGAIITDRKDIIIFNQRMAGYLMLTGYVLLDMRPDIRSSSGKNVFIFKDTPQIRNSMSDYLNH